MLSSLKARVKIQNLQHYDVSKEDGVKTDSPVPANIEDNNMLCRSVNCASATGQRVLLTTDVSKKEKLGNSQVLGPVNAKEMCLPNAPLLQKQSQCCFQL